MVIHDKSSCMCLEKIVCVQAKKKQGVETLICKCKWEKKKLQFARKKRKLQFACKKRKLQFVRKKTRGGKFDLQVCSSHLRANKKDKHEKGNRQVGLNLSEKGEQQWRARKTCDGAEQKQRGGHHS